MKSATADRLSICSNRRTSRDFRSGSDPGCRRVRHPAAYVFGDEAGPFVPDGTRFVLARSPSDESLGYFRASLRDLGSWCILLRSNRSVAGDRFPVEPRMTRVSRTDTDSKVPSGTTDNSPRFQPWVADAKTTRAPEGRKKAAHGAPNQDQRGDRRLPPAQRRGITQCPGDCATRKRRKRHAPFAAGSPICNRLSVPPCGACRAFQRSGMRFCDMADWSP